MSLKDLTKKFVLILSLAFLATVISLPKSLPIKFSLGNWKIDTNLNRPNFNFNIAGKTFNPKFDLKSGLDLSGGISLLYQVNTANVKSDDLVSALEALKQNIERRVNLFGISEANVQLSNTQNEHRLTVELPGVDNSQTAADTIGQTAQLTFKGEKIIAPEATPTATFFDVFSEDTGLNGSHLSFARAEISQQNGQPQVFLKFNSEGTKLFADATKKYKDRRIAMMLDGYPVSYPPTVRTEITTGEAVIDGQFTMEEAKTYAAQLNAGALPLEIKLLSQSKIGATLGADSVTRGIRAGLVGLLVVFLFMIANYGWLGLLADFVLVIYAVLTLALYKLIPVTLTFPGIVGFILSIGMALDSNILIFERLKEELHRGRPWKLALETAFGRAWDSIKDANVCTIITALILFNPFNWSFLNTSGMVRGFAATLLLGIILSIFTGVVVTRNFIRFFSALPFIRSRLNKINN